MTPKQMKAVGLKLFGENWKSPLGHAIGRGYQTILRIADGTDDVPPHIEMAIAGVEAIKSGYVPTWATDAGGVAVVRRAMTQKAQPRAKHPRRRTVAVQVRP